ncbi:hypothetical protein [Treponema phagedenis]|uniref:hypothetical protein n=1 Tax=Treponema phagedenis TaxID=162 RepID=UPI001C073782|nr:hypothetical protein [Treponema phagedenis]
MARKEVTDLWVSKLLEEARIPFYPQGSNIKEIATALKTASKSGTGKSGFPEYTAVIKDFLLVIEDKADIAKHEKKTKNNTLADDKDAVVNYAVNGAIFYGKHLAAHTNYKKILSIGISGDEKRHKISPFFIDERGYHTKLPEIETLISFNEQNIDEYYIKEILKERTDFEKTTAEILREAQSLHEDLRNYGSIQDKDKPLVVSGFYLLCVKLSIAILI